MGVPLRIIWDNDRFDAATLTASSEVATLPVANLQDVQRKRVTRTTGLTGESWSIDFGESIYRTCLVLINHNFTFDGQIRVQASDAADFSVLLKDETYPAWEPVIGFGEGGFGEHGYDGAILESERQLMCPEPIRIIYFREETPTGTLVDQGQDHVQARYWRLLLIDAANPDGYFELGWLYLGLYDAYAKQFSWEFPYGGADDSRIDRSAGGQFWTDRQEMQRSLRLSWKTFRTEDKYWRFLYFVRRVGKSLDWVIDPVPDGSPSEKFFTRLYGRFKEIPEIIPVSNEACELDFEFIEAL